VLVREGAGTRPRFEVEVRHSVTHTEASKRAPSVCCARLARLTESTPRPGHSGGPWFGQDDAAKRLLLWLLRRGGSELGLGSDGAMAHPLFPVFLRLGELRNDAAGLDGFINQQVAAVHPDLPSGYGEWLLQRGHLLLLFDGLDEVANPERRAAVARGIERLNRQRRAASVEGPRLLLVVRWYARLRSKTAGRGERDRSAGRAQRHVRGRGHVQAHLRATASEWLIPTVTYETDAHACRTAR
jgi:hypothetical protein